MTELYGMRLNREAVVFLLEARRLLREPQLVADDIEEIAGIGAVEHGERRIESHGRAMLAQQPVGDRVERARPVRPHPLTPSPPRCARGRIFGRGGTA